MDKRIALNRRSIVFGFDFKVGARMLADRTDMRRFRSHVDMAAVAAFPAIFADLHPDFTLFDIFRQFAVAFFVTLFDFGHAFELGGEFDEAFLTRDLGEVLIHFGPFLMLAGGGGQQVFHGRADAAERLEPEFRVFFFVVGGGFEEGGDLFVAFLAGLTGEIGVFVARLGFPGERVGEIGGGFRSFEFHLHRLLFFGDFHEVRSAVFADRTDKFFRKAFALVNIAADRAAPAAAGGRRRGRFDAALVIGVGHRFGVAEHFGGGNFGYEQRVTAEVGRIQHPSGEAGVDMVRQISHAVGGAARAVAGEFVHRVAALIPEVFEYRKTGGFGEHRDVEDPGAPDHVMGEILLAHRNPDAHRIA
ncbi:hypothetical protein SDC9_98895 [bioreactor metagenome]|uniref:Uncharacterized protein n=1 Tax=bioreactor metagenome TaxID=1076179 RepID=A0A645AG23_9ZZZZ